MTRLLPSALAGMTYSAANVIEGNATVNGDQSYSFTVGYMGRRAGSGYSFSLSNPNDTAGTILVTGHGTFIEGQTVTATVIGNDPNDFLLSGSINIAFQPQYGNLYFQNTAFTTNLPANTVLTVQPLGPDNTYIPPACYAAGTRIATGTGETAVEGLRAGDRVVTRSGALAEIVWIGRRLVDCRRHPMPAEVWPIRIAAGAFGDSLPKRDLFLSPDHAVWIADDYAGALIAARDLVNGTTIRQVEVASIAYFHVELAAHDIILAEGLPAESYLDTGNRAVFANAGVTAPLFPVFDRVADDGRACAPLVTQGPLLEATRARLDAIAAKSQRAVAA